MARERNSGQPGERAGGLWYRARLTLGLAAPRPGTGGWRQDVACAAGDLRDMNRRTEGDFLAVGESLTGFLLAARQIRGDIAEFTNDLSGASGERACQTLSTVLVLARTMQHRVADATRSLAMLRQAARQIQRGFAGFDGVVLSFHLAATLGRIETARLGNLQADLQHLSDEVKSCTEKVRTRVEHAVEVAGGFERCLDTTIQCIAELDLRQLGTLPVLIERVEQSLDAFRREQQQAAARSEGLAREFDSFSAALSNLVTAAQAHDITRQRVEHVIESLEHVSAAPGTAGKHSTQTPEETALIKLQCSQLDGAADAFHASVETIRQELQRIATQGERMAGEAKVLLDLAAESKQESFFVQMEKAFGVVMTAVSSGVDLGMQTSQAAGELKLLGSELRGCIGEIRGTWHELKLLAINSVIRAIHLGESGEAMSVVAGAMQRVYEDAEGYSNSTEESLNRLMEVVLSMAPPGTEDGASMVAELKHRIEDLHGASERGMTCGTRISKAAAELSGGVQTALNGFQAGALFAATGDRCRGMLRRIAAAADARPATPPDGLRHLEHRYTMREERRVHEEALGAGVAESVVAEPPAPATAVPGAGDLGENVELF